MPRMGYIVQPHGLPMATTTTEINLPDIQATPDQRATAIAAVGIRGLELPLRLMRGTVASNPLSELGTLRSALPKACAAPT